MQVVFNRTFGRFLSFYLRSRFHDSACNRLNRRQLGDVPGVRDWLLYYTPFTDWVMNHHHHHHHHDTKPVGTLINLCVCVCEIENNSNTQSLLIYLLYILRHVQPSHVPITILFQHTLYHPSLSIVTTAVIVFFCFRQRELYALVFFFVSFSL